MRFELDTPQVRAYSLPQERGRDNRPRVCIEAFDGRDLVVIKTDASTADAGVYRDLGLAVDR